MPNLVAPVCNRILSRHPGAEIVERGLNSVKHGIGPSSFTLDNTIGAYHYLDAGYWREIDTDADNSDIAGFADRFARSSYRAYVDQYGGRRIYPRRDRLDQYIVVGRPEVHGTTRFDSLSVGTRVRDGNKLVWDTQHFSLEIINTGCQIKLQIVLKDNIAGETLKRLRFPMYLVGLSYSGGAIGDGKSTLALVKHGWLRDAKGNVQTFPVSYLDGYLYMQPDLAGLDYPIAVDPTLDLEVGASANDGYWMPDTGGTDEWGWVAVGYVPPGGPGHLHSWVRFTNVTVPQGANITTAHLTYGAYGLWGTPLTKIYANDVDNAINPTDAADAENRALTSAGVDWDPTGWQRGNSYDSPEIKTVIQEVIDRAGWSSGNALMILHRDDGSGHSSTNYFAVYSYDYGGPPGLHIEYTTGGTVYTKSVAGASSSSGALARRPAKALNGATSSSGSMPKRANKSITSTAASSGALTRRLSRLLSGATMSTGGLSVARRVALALSGVTGSTGAMAKRTAKALGGVTANAGLVGKAVNKTVGATTASSGTVGRKVSKALAGIATSSGAVSKLLPRTLAGAITSTGTVTRVVQRSLIGTMASAGAVVKRISKALDGITASSGGVAKLIGKALAGVTDSAGSLITEIISGAQVVYISLVGATSSSGVLLKQATKTLGGTASSAGALGKVVYQMLAGATLSAGTLSKQARKTFAGTTASIGSLVKVAGKRITGTTASIGTLAKLAKRALAGTTMSDGILNRQASKVFAGTTTIAGAAAKVTVKAFSGLSASVGQLATEIVLPNLPGIPRWVFTFPARARDFSAPTRLRDFAFSARVKTFTKAVRSKLFSFGERSKTF